jgi:two-component system LytT family response regulator
MNSRLKILAVDDEPLALHRIRMICAEMPDVELVGEATGCKSALAEIERARPDILLLDIQMRDGTGFDVIEKLSADNVPAVIFVSAFDHYAIQAFEARVADYVLKPVQFDRLREAIGRAGEARTLADSAMQIEDLKSVVAALRTKMREAGPNRYPNELWIRRNVTGMARVNVDNIEWVSSEDDYVRLHTPDGSYLMRASIRSLLARVDPSLFIRIHRKTLVNKTAIKELRRQRIGRLEIVLQSGERLNAGRVYAKKLRQAISAVAT